MGVLERRQKERNVSTERAHWLEMGNGEVYKPHDIPRASHREGSMELMAKCMSFGLGMQSGGREDENLRNRRVRGR